MSPVPLMANGRLQVGKLTSSSSTDSADTLQMGSPAASSTCWATLRCSTLKPAPAYTRLHSAHVWCRVVCSPLACSRSHKAAFSCTQHMLCLFMCSTLQAAAAPPKRPGAASSRCWDNAQVLHLAVCSNTHAAGAPCTSYALLSLPAQSAGIAGHVRMQSLQEAPPSACSRRQGVMHELRGTVLGTGQQPVGRQIGSTMLQFRGLQ